MTVEQVTGGQLRAFLRQTGWAELPNVGRAGESWIKPGDDDAPAVLVPLDPSDRDYATLMRSALRRLMWVTGFSESEIVSRVLRVSTDILEVSVIDPTTVTGRINLDRGAALTQSLRAVVMNGARLQFAAGRIAHTGGLKEAARKIVDQLELAPPSPGSFRLEVFAPAEQLQLIEGENMPSNATHETLALALRAVDAMREATDHDIPDEPEELDSAVSQGVSPNLVKAVLGLDTQSPVLRIVFRGRWAKPDPETPEIVTLGSHNFAQLARLEEKLRRYEPTEDHVLSGWIKEAAADALALDTPLAGVVVVETRIEGRTRDVRVELTGGELQRAAAGIGQKYLTATGTLERLGRYWYLTDAKDVRVSDLPNG